MAIIDPRGCLYDEEGNYYEDDEGNDYPINPFGECGSDEEI